MGEPWTTDWLDGEADSEKSGVGEEQAWSASKPLDGYWVSATGPPANPALVHTTLATLRRRFPAVGFSLHLHNTRGMGLANMLAGCDAGVAHFDASVAGLGGCPYAPGATGNIATEDAVHMLEEMGIATRVRLDALLDVARQVQDAVGHADSAVLKAGTGRRLLGARRQGQTKLGTS